MPTVLNVGSYRFFFYSNEAGEPAHVHVEDGAKVAKFWLCRSELAKNYGFKGHELSSIRKIVEASNSFFREQWNEHFTAG